MNRMIRVLYADSNAHDRRIIKEALQREHKGFDITEAENITQLIKQLEEAWFDIVLSDINIEEIENMQVIVLVKEKVPDIPVIIVTGCGSEEIAVHAMKMGAADYIIKSPENAHDLASAIHATLRQISGKRQTNNSIKFKVPSFRNYFELSNAGIAIISPVSGWIDANDQLCNMLGYSKDELLATVWTNHIYLVDLEIIREKQVQLVSGETNGYTIDARLIHKSGTLLWTSATVRCVWKGAGTEDYFITSIIDISDRKRTDEALQKTSQELQLIIKNMLNAFIVWESVFDENGNYVSFRFGLFNDAYARISKVKQEDVYGKDVFEVWPDTEQSWVEVYGKVATTGIPQAFDMYHESTKGWYHCNAYRQTDSPQHVCVIFEDITNRRHMEKKLAWEQYLVQSLMENIPDHIYFKDIQSRFLRINKALAETFGLSDPLHAIGKTDNDFFKSEHSREAYHDEQEIIRTGFPIIGKEEKELWPDQHLTWVSTTKMPLIDAKGNIIGTFGISRDITEKKKILDDLVQAKEKAEESGRLKTAFLNNISHEIRTPLNAIIGFSSYLSDPELTVEKRKEFVSIINTSNDQLLSIISDIISLATLDAGQEKAMEKETNVNHLIENVFEQFQVNKIAPKVDFSHHLALSDDMAVINTDPVKLMQILVNLVGNALKFTPKGYVRFGYELKKNQLEFFVEDTGIGIPEDMHKVIFERFRQIDNSSTRKYGGTGLGLALSKGYTELLGSKINIYSKPGLGSTFTFALPYIPDRKVVISNKKSTESPSPVITPGSTILIVEDEISNSMLVEEMLRSFPVTVIKAENGLEALQICTTGTSPDLVLMDIKMPVMDGIEATARIRKSKPGLPIIALTAYATDNDRKRILESGFDAFLEKPIRPKAFYNTVLKFL